MSYLSYVLSIICLIFHMYSMSYLSYVCLIFHMSYLSLRFWKYPPTNHHPSVWDVPDSNLVSLLSQTSMKPPCHLCKKAKVKLMSCHWIVNGKVWIFKDQKKKSPSVFTPRGRVRKKAQKRVGKRAGNGCGNGWWEWVWEWVWEWEWGGKVVWGEEVVASMQHKPGHEVMRMGPSVTCTSTLLANYFCIFLTKQLSFDDTLEKHLFLIFNNQWFWIC